MFNWCEKIGLPLDMSQCGLLLAAITVLSLVLLGVLVIGYSSHVSASSKGVGARVCASAQIQPPSEWLRQQEGLTKIGRGQSGEERKLRSEGVINYSHQPMTGSMWDTPAQMSLGDVKSTQMGYFGSQVLGLDLAGSVSDLE